MILHFPSVASAAVSHTLCLQIMLSPQCFPVDRTVLKQLCLDFNRGIIIIIILTILYQISNIFHNLFNLFVT